MHDARPAVSPAADSLRILYVLPYAPSPIRVRPYQIIRALAQQGHRVTVVALEDGHSTDVGTREMESVCESIHIIPHPRLPAGVQALAALPTTTPLWAAYCRSPRMVKMLRRLSDSGDFDVAHVEHLRAAHFAPVLGNLPRVLDAVDCITALRRQILDQGARGMSRLLSFEEWVKLRSYEPRAYQAYSQIAVTSSHDADALAALFGISERKAGLLGAGLPTVEVIPNGVDLDYFQPNPKVSSNADCLVFSGKMSYVANDDAARFLIMDVLPRLRRLRPAAHLILAGSSPSPSLRALAEQAGNVTVTGFVDDLRPHLQAARVAVCPMRIGVGIQNKALEAMAMGLPVVASPVAARSLRNADGAGLTVAGDADDFAGAVANLLADDCRAAAEGLAARQYVETHHRWDNAAHQFTCLYRRAGAPGMNKNVVRISNETAMSSPGTSAVQTMKIADKVPTIK